MTKKYICPYCYTKYNPIELKYSCNNKICKKSFEYKNLKFFDQLYLAYIGLRPISKCPYCNENDIKYKCPNENCQAEEISFSLIRKNSPIISIIGAKNSGKTVYILSLYKAIFKTGVSFSYITEYDNDDDKNDKQNKEVAFSKVIDNFEKGILPQHSKTIEEGDMTGKPFIFDFNFNKSVLLSFYDSAGEDLVDIQKMKKSYRYLDASSAIIFLVDIFTDDLNRKKSMKVFNHFIQIMKERKNIYNNRKIDIPIVIAFAKYDEVLSIHKRIDGNEFKSDCLWNKENTLETIACIDVLSKKLKEKLIDMKSFEEAVSFIDTCDKTFTNYRFIPIASLALSEELTVENEEKRFNPKTTGSINVELPFLYLLHQLNAI